MNVQDDTGRVAGANSYLSVADFRAYHTSRGRNTSSSNDTAVEAALVNATDYVDRRFRFVGEKLNGRDQQTQWPRINAYDNDNDYVNGIPAEVKDATAEYALRALTGELAPDPTRDESGAQVVSRSETIGPLSESVTFASSGSFRMPQYPMADRILRSSGLTVSGGYSVRG